VPAGKKWRPNAAVAEFVPSGGPPSRQMWIKSESKQANPDSVMTAANASTESGASKPRQRRKRAPQTAATAASASSSSSAAVALDAPATIAMMPAAPTVAVLPQATPARKSRPSKSQRVAVAAAAAPARSQPVNRTSNSNSSSTAVRDDDVKSASSIPAAAPRKQQQQQSKRSAAQSAGLADASNLAREIASQLLADTYECSICKDVIGRRGKVWSCPRCFIIIHLSCIQKWAKMKSENDSGFLSFLCPGCTLEITEKPAQYHCFCSQTVEPNFNAFITPHSCGLTCSRSRGVTCPHPCTLPCHPGPCPPCAALGPLASCPCGRTTFRLRCGEQERKGQTCGSPCSKLLSCGTHKCTAPCHDGPCSPCAVLEPQSCYCGKLTQPRACGSGTREIVNEEAVQQFSCQQPCGHMLTCGSHRCERSCHPGDCPACVRAPSDPQRCGCGKRVLPVSRDNKLGAAAAGAIPAPARAATGAPAAGGVDDYDDGDQDHVVDDADCSVMFFEPASAVPAPPGGITSTAPVIVAMRKLCSDPLPSCGALCNAWLPCRRHRCHMVCHDSPCAPCVDRSPITCRCGKQTKLLTCNEVGA